MEYFSFQEPWFDIGSFSALSGGASSYCGKRVIDAGAKQQGENIFRGSVFWQKDRSCTTLFLKMPLSNRERSFEMRIFGIVLLEKRHRHRVDLSGIALREESFCRRNKS